MPSRGMQLACRCDATSEMGLISLVRFGACRCDTTSEVRLISLVCLGDEPRDRRDEQVCRHQHGSVQPVRVAVLEHLGYQEDTEHLAGRVEVPEGQVHGLVIDPAEHYRAGHHEERNLCRGADRHTQSQVHHPLVRARHRRGVLGRVADDGQQDDADEGLRQAVDLGDVLDGVHQGTRADCHCHGTEEEKHQGDRWRQLALLLILLVIVREQIRVRLQLEEKEQAVDGHQEDGAHPGDHQHLIIRGVGHAPEHRGQAHGDGRHCLACHVGGGALSVELLGLAQHPGGADGHAKNEQQVRENGAQEVALHDLDEPGLDGLDAHDHLHSVAEGGIQQAAEQLPRMRGDGLRG
mmetsp:Transcript_172027/g.551417  ORF Transcript_172027/g.551417 Transcript_172027/m.551417 type:complete len:350 (-) Transcript_172027:263-1312(-)